MLNVSQCQIFGSWLCIFPLIVSLDFIAAWDFKFYSVCQKKNFVVFYVEIKVLYVTFKTQGKQMQCLTKVLK